MAMFEDETLSLSLSSIVVASIPWISGAAEIFVFSVQFLFGGENGFGRGRSLQQNHRIRDHPETETGDLAVPRTAAGEEPPSIHSEGEQTATQWQPDWS